MECSALQYTSNEQSSSKYYQLDYERILGKAYKYLNVYSYEDPLYPAFRRNLNLFYGHEDIEEHNRKRLKRLCQVTSINIRKQHGYANSTT